MNNVWKILIIANLAACTCMLALHFFKSSNGIAYIDTYKLYSGFTMKKQLQKQLEDLQRQQKQKLDSLKLDIQVAELKMQQQKVKDENAMNAIVLKKREFLMRQEQTTREQEAQAERFDSQIWAQLNQYIGDYGKEHHMNFIFGANGNGSVMYGDNEQDITETITAYVNERHKGL